MTITVKSVSRGLLRLGFATLFVLLIVGVLAPLIDAAHYSGRIREALEASLGRKVDFREVHFALFSGLGFSVDAVTIHENPRYGIEPFAYVPTLQARVRIDKLLVGRIQFSSLRLVEPSLNLVKRSDGAWNIVELVERLRPPRRVSLNLFPTLEIANARVDFKFGIRKTTLYVADSDISIYPEGSGKLYIQFSGSPARTDRAGNGFGHFHGTANWYFTPRNVTANQLEANVTLDPSDLSEIATLLEGFDVGVHGTASGKASIDGPPMALRVSGELDLQDVHRWDLFPGAGEKWQIGYHGNIDLLAQSFSLEALPIHANGPVPVMLEMRVKDFFVQPSCSVLAHLNKVPAENLLPLSKQMGVALPGGLALAGTVDGAIGYSNRSGLAGGLVLADLVATLPGVPPLHAAFATAKISSGVIHFDPAVVQTSFGGTLRAGGHYNLGTRKLIASLKLDEFPVDALENLAASWFSAPSALAAFEKGDLTGQLIYKYDGTEPPLWSGQVDFANAILVPPGVAVSLTRSDGRLAFDHSTFNLQRFSGSLGEKRVKGDYYYSALLKHSERLRLHLPSADLAEIEVALEPTLRPQGLLARLRFGRRTVPAWLATRNMEADVIVDAFSVNSASVGSLRSRVVWQGTTLQFNSVQLNLPTGLITAHGTLNLAAYSPRCRFAATVSGFPWRGGVLNADGIFETSGTGLEAAHNLRASGTFSGEDISLSPEDSFSKVSGQFEFAFDAGWPDLRLSKIQASQGEEGWIGEAASQSDGKLIFDLENASGQRRVVSTLESETPAASSALTTGTGSSEGELGTLRQNRVAP
ncbi:MAG: AsmA family protein [Bryobacteraceae bacterium]